MVIEECESSLQCLGIDYIDVYQDHVWWDENTKVFAEAFLKLKQQGKIRRPEKDALPYCQERDIGVIVRGPLAMGKLTGKFTPETTFPEGDVRRGWTSADQKPNFIRDLEFVEKLRFLEKERTMPQAALAYVLIPLSRLASLGLRRRDRLPITSLR